MFFDLILPLLFLGSFFYLAYRSFKKEAARQERNRRELLHSINGITYVISEHTAAMKRMCSNFEEETLINNDNFTK